MNIPPTSAPGLDLASNFDSDWQQAQARVQAATSSGLSDEDAQKLYLAPIQAKWSIIQDHPNAFTTKSNLDKINQEFEDAQVSAVKNLNRSESTDETVGSRISPLAQKWSIAAQFPQQPKDPTIAETTRSNANNPALLREEKDTQQRIDSGQPETQAISSILRTTEPFSRKWNPRYKAAAERESKAAEDAAKAAKEAAKAAKEAAVPELEPLIKQRNFYSNQLDTSTNLPPMLRTKIGNTISAIDASLTNDVSTPFSLGVKFQPPADDSTNQPAYNAPAAAQPPQPATPTSKSEFDSLPSGSLYVNPADGKVYRKK